MKIKWLGHSCFKMASKEGIRVVTDPFDDNLGYKIPSVEADIVTVSHGHYDHNFVDCINGDYEVVNKVGNFSIKNIAITGVHTFHDKEEGAKNGDNIVYTFDIDGIKVCHLGDLGHKLAPSQIAMIGDVDVLMIPVGGTYTLDAEEAVEVIAQLNPSITIPMHYKTPVLTIKIDKVDKFLEAVGEYEEINKQVIEIKKEELKKGKNKVIVMKYE